ncbi:integrase core domain-containing protein [Candidatus Poriferisodalis sp.]|uniref:integrase core domain-containing protein n=1 Tax=Candidatus Poriferisodalis sp. TaxID=3101277 RepID=UPI003D0BE7BF
MATKGSRQHRKRIGCTNLHTVVGDDGRVVYVGDHDEDQADTHCGFWRRAQDWFWSNQMPVDEVLTDIGPNFISAKFAELFAQRWIGTLRRELLDRTIIWNQRQLNRLVVDYIDHYNTHRPHRSLNQLPPVATDAADQPDGNLQVVKTARCGELINEYRNAA